MRALQVVALRIASARENSNWESKRRNWVCEWSISNEGAANCATQFVSTLRQATELKGDRLLCGTEAYLAMIPARCRLRLPWQRIVFISVVHAESAPACAILEEGDEWRKSKFVKSKNSQLNGFLRELEGGFCALKGC